MERFCYRNAEMCEKTSSLVDTVYQKFRTTAEMIEELLRGAGFGAEEQNLNEEASPQARPQRQGKANAAVRGATTSSVPHGMSQNTLTREDLRPTWNGPGRVAYETRAR